LEQNTLVPHDVNVSSVVGRNSIGEVGVGERAETASDTGPCHDTDQYGPDAAGEPTPGTVQHSVPSDMTDTPLTGFYAFIPFYSAPQLC